MFDVSRHLTRVQGAEYLEVKWRVVWFRQEHPAEEGWGIVTEAQEVNEHFARFRAEVRDAEGRVIATATGTERPHLFADYVEKAETAAIGRALALAGYGTQFAPELAEGAQVVDAPVRVEGMDEEEGPMCPQCGGPMRLRKGRAGEFWGCVGYPDCRGTRPRETEGKGEAQ